MIHEFKTKTKEQLAEEYFTSAEDTTLRNAQYPSALLVKSAEDIESALDKLGHAIGKATKDSDQFSSRIYYLNIILATATAVGAIATLTNVFIVAHWWPFN